MKLQNNFKNYSKMIQESKKDLPENFCKLRTGYINPSGRITYNRINNSQKIGSNTNYIVTSYDDYIDQLYSYTKSQKIKYYQCDLGFSEFFRIIDLEWFKRRFCFDTISEVKKCGFARTFIDGSTVMIVKIVKRFGYSTYVIELP